MKKFIVFYCTLFTVLTSFSQQKNGLTFFETNANLTFKINENFEFGNTNGESFFVPSEILLRFGIGYEYKKKIALSFNTGFDYHFDYFIGTIPTYFTFQYNLWTKGNDAFYMLYNTGRLWRLAERFSDGDYRGFGIGWRFESGSTLNTTFKIIYHQKKIKNFENGSYDNISLGIGFTIF
jgi:hypothetical protein